MGHTFRFTASSALNSVLISQRELMNLVLIGSGTTASNRVFASVRVRGVEMWGPMSSTLAPVTVSIEYDADTSVLGARKLQKSDTSMGATRSAYVSLKPRPRSLASMWFGDSASNNLFRVSGPAGTVLDLHLSLVLRNTEVAAGGPTGTGVSDGRTYCAPLDSDAASSSQFVPVGWRPYPLA